MKIHPDFSPSTRACAGFTLLEVLIPLAVFAVASATLLSALGGNSRQAAYLEGRTMASWVARDVMAQVLSDPQWPDIGRSSEEITFAGRRWEAIRDVQSTTSDHLRRIEVTVVPRAERGFLKSDERLAFLVAFKGQY